MYKLGLSISRQQKPNLQIDSILQKKNFACLETGMEEKLAAKQRKGEPPGKIGNAQGNFYKEWRSILPCPFVHDRLTIELRDLYVQEDMLIDGELTMDDSLSISDTGSFRRGFLCIFR